MLIQFFNQFSFLLFIVSPVLLLALYTIRSGRKSRLLQFASMALLSGVVIGYFFLRPSAGAESVHVAGRLPDAAGRPLLLEIYSDY